MKNNLGKVLLFLLFVLHVELFASTYEWSAIANKEKAYIDEAIHLSYKCTFSDRAELYSIEFNPIGEYEDYRLILLTEGTKVIAGKKINFYEFIAFVKKAGDMKFTFDALMKKTNEDSIKNTVLGRDNAFYEEFTKVNIKQKTLHVEILDTPENLVGDFDLEIKKDKTEVKAYQPYHMEIIIKGLGDLESIKPLKFTIDGVKIFTGKLIKNIKLSKDGYKGEISQKFAFVSSKDFSIPSINIEYFDLTQNSIKTLHVDKVDVKVIKGYVKKELLDEDMQINFKMNYDYFYYLLFFILGFILSKIKFIKIKKELSKDEVLKDKITKCKNLDEVMFVLLLNGRDKYKKLIQKIENKECKSINDVLLNMNTFN